MTSVVANEAGPGRRSSAGAIAHPRWAARPWKWLAAWLVLSLGLVALKYPVLDAPPYNEYAETIWTEAAFLAETDFDLHRLIFEEPQVEEGGVRAYSYLALPVIASAALRSLGPEATFAAYRVVALGLAAGVILWTFARLARHFGGARATAVCAALYSLAFVVVGLEMLSLELPLAATLVAAVHFFGRRRFLLAAGLCLVAFFVKPTALPACASMLIVLILWRAAQWRGFDRRSRGLNAAIAAYALVLLSEWGILQFVARDAQLGHRIWWLGPVVSGLLAALLTPYVFPLLGAAAWLEGAWWLRWWSQRRGRRIDSAARVLVACVRRQPELAVGVVYVAAVLASFARVMFEPRYLISLVPFLAIVLADALFRRLRWTRLAWIGLAVLIVYNAINAHGRLLPSLDGRFISARSWISMERSLEYRVDLAATREACRLLARRNDREPVLVGKLMTHLLSSPYFGYVDRPLSGYTVVDNFHLGRLRPAIEMLDDRPKSLLIVSIPQGEYVLPAAGADGAADEVLWSDRLVPPLVVHRHRFESNDRSSWEEFYSRELLAKNDAPYTRCSLLASRGNDALGLKELARRYRQTAVPNHLLTWLSVQLRKLGCPTSAEALGLVVKQRRATSQRGQYGDPRSF